MLGGGGRRTAERALTDDNDAGRLMTSRAVDGKLGDTPWAFAKYRFPGRLVLFGFIIGTIMIPTTALAIPTCLVFSAVGMTNTPLSIILPSLISPIGLYLVWIYAVTAIPDSVIEAARIDGAGELRILTTIGLRLMAPAIVTVFLFALVATWNNYLLPLIMLNDDTLYPLSVGLTQSGNAITASLIAMAPLVVAFLVLQRFWRNGLGAGAMAN